MGVGLTLTLMGREEKSRVNEQQLDCIVEDLGVWVPLYAIVIFIFCLGREKKEKEKW